LDLVAALLPNVLVAFVLQMRRTLKEEGHGLSEEMATKNAKNHKKHYKLT
jgi:hypothetical protein